MIDVINDMYTGGSMIEQPQVILIVRCMSEAQARQAVDDAYGSVMWSTEEDGVCRCYPDSSGNQCEIIRDDTKVQIGG